LNLLSIMQSLLSFASTISLDDSSLALLALLAGMAGGWSITLIQEQRKKKLGLERKRQEREPPR